MTMAASRGAFLIAAQQEIFLYKHKQRTYLTRMDCPRAGFIWRTSFSVPTSICKLGCFATSVMAATGWSHSLFLRLRSYGKELVLGSVRERKYSLFERVEKRGSVYSPAENASAFQNCLLRFFEICASSPRSCLVLDSFIVGVHHLRVS